jgi:hypothetical protein
MTRYYTFLDGSTPEGSETILGVQQDGGEFGVGISSIIQIENLSVLNSIGIGTTNPQYELDVNGDINFEGTLNQNGAPFVASRWTSGTGNEIYRLNGNVGIGTTNPDQLLDLAANNTGLTTTTTNNTLRFTDLDTTTAENQPLGKIEWYTSDISLPRVVSYILSSAASVFGGGDLRFGVSSGGSGAVSEAVRITGSGRVGIGTINPGQLLDLAANNTGLTTTTTNNTLRFTDLDTTTAENQPLGKIEWYTSDTSATGNRAVSYILSSSAGPGSPSTAGADIRFGVSGNDGIVTEAVRITSSSLVCSPVGINATASSVGIGTISFTARLHVYESNGGPNPLVKIENPVSTLFVNGGTLLDLHYSGNSDVSTGTSAYFVKCQDSNTVLGGIRAASGTSLNYETTSDYRLKENITPLQNGIERVMQLKPCEFTWKRNQTRSDGFIAHEVQEIIPNAVTGSKDAVTEDGDIDPQMIDPSKMIPVLTSALQEAIQRIKYLESVVGMGSH